MLALKVTPIVGLPQFTGWSQVAESTASVSSKVICVFSVSGKHAGNVGRDISEQISNFYYYDSQQLHDFLQQLVDFAYQNNCKLFFAIAVFSSSKSVFATYGGSIFLKREEKSGKILTSDFEIKLIEGDFQKNDTFVLSTQQADKFLNEIQQKFLQGFETDTIITSVVPGLHSQHDSSLSAMVFIAKEAREETEKSVVPEPTHEGMRTQELTEHDDDTADLSEEIDLQGNILGTPKILDTDVKDLEKNSNISVEISASNERSEAFLKQITKILRKIQSFFVSFFKWLLDFTVKLFKKVRHLLVDFVRKSPSTVRKIRNLKFKEILKFRPKKNVYVVSIRTKKNSKKLMIIAAISIVCVAVIAYFLYARSQESERISRLIAPINQEYSQIQAIAINDPIQAREQLEELLDRLETLESENQESAALGDITQLKNEIAEFNESISGQEELTELDIFYDLRLIKSDYIASKVDFNAEKVLLLDAQMKEVVLLNFGTKEVQLRELSEFESVTDAVLTTDTVLLLADGVREFATTQDSEIIELRSEGDSNRTGSIIAAYDRYVYVVNPEKRNIYRYAESDGEYSEPIGWMRGAPGVNYNEIVSVSIDGDLWLSTQSGDIRKFASGIEEDFVVRGLEAPFSSEIFLYTDESSENLYVLDPTENRVVILNKSGDFIKEFKSVSLGAANGIAVSEEDNTILITAGSLVYQIQINS